MFCFYNYLMICYKNSNFLFQHYENVVVLIHLYKVYLPNHLSKDHYEVLHNDWIVQLVDVIFLLILCLFRYKRCISKRYCWFQIHRAWSLRKTLLRDICRFNQAHYQRWKNLYSKSPPAESSGFDENGTYALHHFYQRT